MRFADKLRRIVYFKTETCLIIGRASEADDRGDTGRKMGWDIISK